MPCLFNLYKGRGRLFLLPQLPRFRVNRIRFSSADTQRGMCNVRDVIPHSQRRVAVNLRLPFAGKGQRKFSPIFPRRMMNIILQVFVCK